MKTILIAIGCAVVAVVGLAACGGGGESEFAPSVDATPSGTPQPLRAPEFSLPSASGETVTLSAVLSERRGAALVFYRGFF